MSYERVRLWNGYTALFEYGAKTTPSVKHPATKPVQRYFNKCKSCNKVDKGRIQRMPNKRTYWVCPHCLNMQGYSS